MVYYATTQLVPTASRPLSSRISSIFSRKNAPRTQMLHSLKRLHSSDGRRGSLIKSGALSSKRPHDTACWNNRRAPEAVDRRLRPAPWRIRDWVDLLYLWATISWTGTSSPPHSCLWGTLRCSSAAPSPAMQTAIQTGLTPGFVRYSVSAFSLGLWRREACRSRFLWVYALCWRRPLDGRSSAAASKGR